MMKDPLNDIDWSNLYQRYDAKCNGFQKNSVFLAAFTTDRPTTDRALYYKLISLFSEKSRISTNDAIFNYEGLLYWKLYSQRTTNYNMNRWLRHDISARNQAQKNILRLFRELPKTVEKSVPEIVELVKWIGDFEIPGMASKNALPVRTTLLHFLYPDVVPIFDKMVLKAVGAWESGANHKISVLSEYLPFVWNLAEQHTKQLSSFTQETPIRVLDMALWVGRGKEWSEYD